MAVVILFGLLFFIGTAFAGTTQNPNLGSSVSTDIRVQKCAKCFYLEGGLPLNLQNYVEMPGTSDKRCKLWNDNIPVTSYEDCGTPIDGEANACMFLNMTLIIQNVVTSALGTVGGAAGSAVNTANSAINNPVGSVVSVLTGGGSTMAPSGITLPSFLQKLPLGRRGKRQASNIFGQIGGAIGGAASSAIGGAVSNVIPGGIKLPDFIPSGNGTYTYKIFYKGCVRLSLLETLSGSNCRLDPEYDDIKFFSQQSLLQPFMDFLNTMNGGLSGLTGTATKVDGLCYINKKEFTKQLWKTMLHYDPSQMPKV